MLLLLLLPLQPTWPRRHPARYRLDITVFSDV